MGTTMTDGYLYIEILIITSGEAPGELQDSVSTLLFSIH